MPSWSRERSILAVVDGMKELMDGSRWGGSGMPCGAFLAVVNLSLPCITLSTTEDGFPDLWRGFWICF